MSGNSPQGTSDPAAAAEQATGSNGENAKDEPAEKTELEKISDLIHNLDGKIESFGEKTEKNSALIQNISNQKDNELNTVRNEIQEIKITPPSFANGFHPYGLYGLVVILVLYGIYQYIIIHKLKHTFSQLHKSKSSTPNPQPQRATEMNPMNPKTGTGNYHPLPPEEMIDPGSHSALSNHHTSLRKPFNTDIKASTIEASTKEETSKQTEPPKQLQKEEVKKDKFFDERIAFYKELESLGRKIKRKYEDDRDHFAKFAKKNIELKNSLENIIATMNSLTPCLLDENRVRYESYIKSLAALLVSWEGIYKDDYNIVKISPEMGENYRAYNPAYIDTKQSVDTNDPKKDNTIAEVLEEGWCLEDRVLYPASIHLYRYKPSAENKPHSSSTSSHTF